MWRTQRQHLLNARIRAEKEMERSTRLMLSRSAGKEVERQEQRTQERTGTQGEEAKEEQTVTDALLSLSVSLS